MTSGYTDCLVREATEIHLHKNNFNRDCGFMMCQAWSPITNMLMKAKGRTGQSRYLNLPTNPLVSPPAITCRYITRQVDFGSSQFPGDMDRDGP